MHSNISGAIKVVSFRSSQGNLSLIEITRASPNQYYFPENFRRNLAHYEKENFFDSSLQHSFESENFRLPFSREK